VKTVTDKRAEDLLPVGRSRADVAILWIDDASGKIVDRASRPEPCTEVEDPAMAVSSRRRMREAGRVFIDLVGLRSSVTMADGARAERTRLSARLVRLLPARGGGS
jgi:hypothetical protein